MPKLTIDELNEIYREAEAVDKQVFAEQRSNVLLVAGEHYSKRGLSRTLNRLKTNINLTENQKLRLTKNHVHNIHRRYVENIMTFSPGVAVAPQEETSMQDQKAAELNMAVWKDAKHRYRLKEKKRKWCRNFVALGEVCLKLFWNPDMGDFKGYDQMVDEAGNPVFETDEFGQMVVDEQGQPIPVPDETKPVFSGAFDFEDVYGFNLLRMPGSDSMEDSECWIVRKMVDVKVLKNRYKDDPTKMKFITKSNNDSFVVFDQDKHSYNRVKNQCIVREYYWKPSKAYPNGYFVFATDTGVLEEGELPYGIFPLVWAAMDEHPTSARGRSVLKVARPYQAEINRAASSMAQTQIQVGDDKILYQAGSKLQQGALLPGVRGITYQGQAPTILPGRDGGQYLTYIESQIRELYSVLMVDEDGMEKSQGTNDNYALIFRSMRHQKRFAEYGERFEQFLKDVCFLFLELARKYLPDDALIQAIGKKEIINIEEFRNTTPLDYQIVVEERDDTVETKFGKQLVFNHIMQYVGPNLDQNMIGKLIKNSPFMSNEDTFSELTIDEDNVRNDMLQMERGQMPNINPNDNHEYIIKKLNHRMKQPDFEFLPPQVQQMYAMKVEQHTQMIAQLAEREAALKDQFIPVDGAMIATDMYVPNPQGPDKPAKRVRIPYQALDWLVKRLEAQGSTLEKIEDMNKKTISDVATMLIERGATSPQGQSASGFQNAPASALGVSG